jgi:hypothetical protein
MGQTETSLAAIDTSRSTSAQLHPASVQSLVVTGRSCGPAITHAATAMALVTRWHYGCESH